MLRSLHDFILAFLAGGVAVCVAGFLYARYVRPLLLERGLLDFEAGWRAKLKAHWDIYSAAAISGLAASWDTILDIVVVVNNSLPDALQALQGVDLTPFELPGWIRTGIQIGSVLMPIIRAARLKAQ